MFVSLSLFLSHTPKRLSFFFFCECVCVAAADEHFHHVGELRPRPNGHKCGASR